VRQLLGGIVDLSKAENRKQKREGDGNSGLAMAQRDGLLEYAQNTSTKLPEYRPRANMEPTGKIDKLSIRTSLTG
jgi:hypothetical protein